MKNLFYRLIIYLDTANEKDTNYNIALFMANNFALISGMRISELANACFVSPATISRFCRALGYENYAHLKQECRMFESDVHKFNNLINIPAAKMKSQPVAATREYVNQVIATMQDLPNSLDWNVIDQVLKLIHDYKQVVFFGTQFSNSAAMHFQTDLLMLGKFTTAYMDTERQLECAMNMTKDSVAIVVSVNGNFMGTASKMMKYLKKSKCKVVLITSEERNFLNIPIDYRIKLSMPKDGKSGKHALLTTVELMSLRYYTLYSPSEKNKR
ncbi:MurR/RpiR family transcriptional regulator [Kandleria vitulina]|uniref:MurR/RpiR family transcriptional regulator n=1 Tax=Kandleria vitulina TaxID=1630 RepID=UPI0033215124